jgi:DNA (cytosine-5)-methyltransferase 1
LEFFKSPDRLNDVIINLNLPVPKKKIIGIDLFCGVGGMTLGFEQAGVNVVAAIDIEKINVESHKINFPNCEAIQADLSIITGKDIRKKANLKADQQIDIIFGGPPCQSFSLIGKRKDDDPRGDLITHFARIVKELKPKYFVMENVKGLTLGKAKDKLDAFIADLKKAGYNIPEYQVLNAADYGVPQNRRRVFVIGAKKGNELPDYPKPIKYGKNRKQPTVWDAISDLIVIENANGNLKEGQYIGKLGQASSFALKLRQEKEATLSGNLRTTHTEATIIRFEETLPGSYEPISRFYRLKKDGVSNTLRAGTGSDHGSYMAARPIHPVYPRCITVREAARLHTYPDWVEFHPTNWHGFRQVGNSVPPKLARTIAQSIKNVL